MVVASPLLLRSLLFVPATRPDRFQKAFDSGADAVVIDLEDSVEPARKAEARRAAGEWLAAAPPLRAACFIRVNAPGFPWQDDDLRWLASVSARVDAVVLPKAETVSAILDVADAARGRRVLPLLETARGILHASEILSARAEIPAVLFGAEDLTAELGIPRTLDGDELLYARSRVVLAAATIGADAIDAVWVHLAPADALLADARRAKALGFRGKMAIHPDQVAIINQAFSPSSEEIAAARGLVEADERARAAGDGVFRFNDQMVDAPVIKRAKRVLELAERLYRS